MKAWVVQDLPECVFSGIVFAETAGKAKKYCVDHEDVVGIVAMTDLIRENVRNAQQEISATNIKNGLTNIPQAVLEKRLIRKDGEQDG